MSAEDDGEEVEEVGSELIVVCHRRTSQATVSSQSVVACGGG